MKKQFLFNFFQRNGAQSWKNAKQEGQQNVHSIWNSAVAMRLSLFAQIYSANVQHMPDCLSIIHSIL